MEFRVYQSMEEGIAELFGGWYQYYWALVEQNVTLFCGYLGPISVQLKKKISSLIVFQ